MGPDTLQTPESIHQLRVNGRRLDRTIAQLATIGALPEGGISRLAFSSEDIQARAAVKRLMIAAGMAITVDAAGNIIGRYSGYCPGAPALATGSHLDSVPVGGIYDGTYGVLAGIEVVQTLHDSNLRLAHPIEVIVFTDEESTMVGSKAMAGQLRSGKDTGLLRDNLRRIGGSLDGLASVRRSIHDFAAFVELHVEQGPVLEAAGNPIGLVTGIVGQRRYVITIDGRASHAGTTPMAMRQDALLAAAKLVVAVNRIGNAQAADLSGEQVATVGALTLTPNAVNTIPGQVEMTVDMRDLSDDCLDRMAALLEREIEAAAAATQTRILMQPTLKNKPAPANSHIHHTIGEACQSLALDTLSLPSRASHDAQNMAYVTDMGMIFVPSRAGLSHATDEYTSPHLCAQGANVLLQTLVRLDRHYRV